MAGKIIDKLFDTESRDTGTLKYNMIRVFDAYVHEYPNDPKNKDLTGGAQLGFSGILQNNFTYNVNADWEAKLANIDLPLFGKAIKSLYGDTSRTGIFTEKFYQGASYLVITPKFRVVDWNGTGVVLQTAQKVVNKLLPTGNKTTVSELYSNNDAFIQDIGKSGAGALGNLASSVVGAGKIALARGDISDAASNLATTMLDGGGGVINKLLWGEPEPVRIEIGNYFNMNNMILESATIEFSKEMTAVGPLYADFDCQFSSKLALVKGNTGLIPMNASGERVRIAGTFAEDRAFPKKELERAQKYAANYRYTQVEESWLLAKLRDDFNFDLFGDQ